MPAPSSFVLPATILFAITGSLILLVAYRRYVQRPSADLLEPGAGAKPPKHMSIAEQMLLMECGVCLKDIEVPIPELRVLDGPEAALVVSEVPSAVGKDMREYRCPHCDAGHVFVMAQKGIQYLTTNAYEAQTITNRCTNCRNRLSVPNVPEGTYVGSGDDGVLPSDGLCCSRCAAVCCLQCVKDATRNRTEDGSYLCPRCHRGPVDALHYF